MAEKTVRRRASSRIRKAFAIVARIALVFFAAFAALAFLADRASAQAASQTSGAIVGQITGEDISISTPSQSASAESAQSIQFTGGSTIVVHSGQARVEFTGGGELDICGPAKFTVLASGEALTIALSFGRVHLKLDPSRPVTIYTALITAVPLAVMSEPRDVTLGLEPNTGAMCVLAAHGAVQVQQQLSGETLIVPEPSEVLLSATPLRATPASAGGCRCEFSESAAKAAPPDSVAATKTMPVEMATESAERPSGPAQPSPPTAARPTNSPPNLPSANGPILKIVAPPLVYDAKAHDAPTETISVATLLLAKEAVVEPAWIFHGVVVAPAKAPKKVQGKDSKAAATNQDSANQRKKKGFWARFRDLLLGSSQKAA